jgi:hypothetical protein
MLIYSGTLTETITPPGTTTDVGMNVALVNGAISYNVTISNGNVLVQESGSWNPSTQTGTFHVVDHNGAWNCSATNGRGTCYGSERADSFLPVNVASPQAARSRGTYGAQPSALTRSFALSAVTLRGLASFQRASTVPYASQAPALSPVSSSA